MAYCEEGIFKGYRSRSPPIVMDSFLAISPLNTAPMDDAPELLLHGSAKVPGSVNMEKKRLSMVLRKLKYQQYEVQDLRTVALRHVTRQINKMKPLLADFSNLSLCHLKWKI